MHVARNPQFLRIAAIAAVETPLPMPDITPPAMKIYLAIIFFYSPLTLLNPLIPFFFLPLNPLILIAPFCLNDDFYFSGNSSPFHLNFVFSRFFNRLFNKNIGVGY